MGGVEQAIESAHRSWQAAMAHLVNGDLKTAGALIRLTGRYVERLGEEQGQTLGEVVPFPLQAVLTASGPGEETGRRHARPAGGL